MLIPYPLRGTWAITQDGADLVMDVWERAHLVPQAERIAAALDARGGEPFPDREERELDIINGVAIVKVEGPLVRHGGMLSQLSGIGSYEAIGQDIDAITEQFKAGAVHDVIFKFRTPGGQSDGCNECAKKIATLRDLMGAEHVIAFVEGQCASAGYWLASQCGWIICEEAALVGCIGVIMELVDSSGEDQQKGRRRIQIVSTGAEAKRSLPLDKSVLTRRQVLANDQAAFFYDAVAAGRDTDVETVLADFGGGDVVTGNKALAARMVDELGNWDSTLARYTSGGGNNRTAPGAPARGNMTMKTPNGGAASAEPEKPAAAAAASADSKCAKCDAKLGAKAYCTKCFDEDEEEDDKDGDAKSLAAAGLLGATRGATRLNLVAFVASALKMTGKATADAALGAMKAGQEAITSLDTERVKAETDARTKAKTDVVCRIEAAVKAGKLTLGEVAGVADFMSSDAEADKIRAGLSQTMQDPRFPGDATKTIAVPQTLTTILAVFNGATFDAKDVRRIGAYLDAKAPGIPALRPAPAPTPANFANVNQQTAAAAAGLGLDPVAVAEHGELRADLSIEAMQRRADEAAKAKRATE